MNRVLFSGILIIVLMGLHGCNKGDDAAPVKPKSNINENAIVLNDETTKSLVSVDPGKLVFQSTGKDIDKIKVGSIIVSDITPVATDGLLRKVTSVSIVGNTIVFTTEDAALTDVINNGKVKFNKTFTNADILSIDSSGVDLSAGRVSDLSFEVGYDKVLYDEDNNTSTENDQITLEGNFIFEPTFDFELDIVDQDVKKFYTALILKNTNEINVFSEATLKDIKKEIVIRTFQLKPFTIIVPPNIPIPIAKQWIVIVLGVDGSLSAKISAGVTNVNTATAGCIYENAVWNDIMSQENSFTRQPLVIEGANARIEPWLMLRYEIRPYGIKSSRIYLGVRGSMIGEGIARLNELDLSLKFGVKLSALAQMQIFKKSVLNYEKVFFEKEFPIYETTWGIPQISTNEPIELQTTTVKVGGEIISNGGSEITAKGICYSTSPNPTILNNKSNEGPGGNSFISSLNSLTEKTTYYARAYATNGFGTGYGNEINFTTIASQVLPAVTTASAIEITASESKVGGLVTSEGSSAVTESGVYWGTSNNPETTGLKLPMGSGLGLFSGKLANLQSNTTYYVKAYATNSVGTVYGSEIHFTTLTPMVLPQLTTIPITRRASTSAGTGGATIIDNGVPVIEKGICWSTLPNPTIQDSKINSGQGTEDFTVLLTSLSPNTIYYVKAYAININGITYGNEVSFSTLERISDIDGNSYNAVEIGNQIWLQENLKTSKYSNGDLIALITDNSAWAATNSGAYSYLYNSAENNNIYGKLYNGFTVADQRKLCPNGWHVSTKDEWVSLLDYLGDYHFSGTQIVSYDAGNKLKVTGTQYWKWPNESTNETGFSALPGYYRNGDGQFFGGQEGTNALFWTELNASDLQTAYYLSMNNSATLANDSNFYYGFSVRCVKDN